MREASPLPALAPTTKTIRPKQSTADTCLAVDRQLVHRQYVILELPRVFVE